VTRGAVRCSAWLGVAVIWVEMFGVDSLKPSLGCSVTNQAIVRGSIGNPSLAARCLKMSVGSAPDKAITLLGAAVVVVISDAVKAKLPVALRSVSNLVVNLN